MVENLIATVDPNVRVDTTYSSVGKAIRGAPVAGLFEQRRCHMLGAFQLLEDQLCCW